MQDWHGNCKRAFDDWRSWQVEIALRDSHEWTIRKSLLNSGLYSKMYVCLLIMEKDNFHWKPSLTFQLTVFEIFSFTIMLFYQLQHILAWENQVHIYFLSSRKQLKCHLATRFAGDKSQYVSRWYILKQHGMKYWIPVHIISGHTKAFKGLTLSLFSSPYRP